MSLVSLGDDTRRRGHVNTILQNHAYSQPLLSAPLPQRRRLRQTTTRLLGQ